MLPRYIIVAVFSALASQAVAVPQQPQLNRRFEIIHARTADGPSSVSLAVPAVATPTDASTLVARELEKRADPYAQCATSYKIGKQSVEWLSKTAAAQAANAQKMTEEQLKRFAQYISTTICGRGKSAGDIENQLNSGSNGWGYYVKGPEV